MREEICLVIVSFVPLRNVSRGRGYLSRRSRGRMGGLALSGVRAFLRIWTRELEDLVSR